MIIPRIASRMASLLGLVFLLGAPAFAASPLFVPSAENIPAIKSERGNPLFSIDASAGAPALKVVFPEEGGTPELDIPGGPWNLAGFAGIEAEITNLGSSRLVVHMRIDNPGDWKAQPWNANHVGIKPGETKTLRVTFGQSYGKPGYALDPSRVSVIKLFASRPPAGSSILLRSLTPFAAFGASATTPAQPASAAPPGADATFSPPIGGELLDLSKPDALAAFDYAGSSAVLENDKIKATFLADVAYPNIQFPIPAGGWNLSSFGGIEITLTNPGARRVVAHLRADNPGDWKAQPWNTERLGVGPGETKTIRLVFGRQGGAPAFPLNPARISAIQLFLGRVSEPTTLIISDLRAAGSPATASDSDALTKPEDRDRPVIPPAWLGSRPPVEGNWVATLDENFDGDKLNEKLWTNRMTWDGPSASQLQRYAPENVVVAGGVAAFVAEKRHGHENNNPALGTRDYTSGIIQSYDKWSQKYGYMEARIKLPTARGLWPAFWTMPDRGRDSGLDKGVRRSTSVRHGKGMEIDILEHLAEWGPGRNNVAVHWDGYGPNHQSWGTSHVYFGPTPDGWHAFGLLWEPGKLTWFIDGKKVVEWENERVADVPAYIKLNIQIGGWATRDVDDAALPDRMLVDYVRAWQLRERL